MLWVTFRHNLYTFSRGWLATKLLKFLLRPSRKQFPTSQTTGAEPESIQQGVSAMMVIEHHAGQNSRGSSSSSSATSSSHALNKRFVCLFDYFKSFITWGSVSVALKFIVPGKGTVCTPQCAVIPTLTATDQSPVLTIDEGCQPLEAQQMLHKLINSYQTVRGEEMAVGEPRRIQAGMSCVCACVTLRHQDFTKWSIYLLWLLESIILDVLRWCWGNLLACKVIFSVLSLNYVDSEVYILIT